MKIIYPSERISGIDDACLYIDSILLPAIAGARLMLNRRGKSGGIVGVIRSHRG